MAIIEGKKRGLFNGQVIVNEKICREHYLITIMIPLEEGFPESVPGQFVQLGCAPVDAADVEDRLIEWEPGENPSFENPELVNTLAFLRKPFSIAGRRDAEHGVELDFIYRVVGFGTDWLSHLTLGAKIDLIGPLGNRFEIPEEKSIGLLVGGGVGLPPMFYLAEALHEAGWSGCGFVGAMTKDLLAVRFMAEPPANGEPSLCTIDFSLSDFQTVINTDDGTYGMKGLITDGVRRYIEHQTDDERERSVIYTCGPERMMEAVYALGKEFGITVQVCMEQAMACGMGTCQSCIVRIRGLRNGEEPHGHLDDGTPWRYRLACTDGPVFDPADVIWN